MDRRTVPEARILQFGGGGQLGRAMIAAANGSEDIVLRSVARAEADFTRPDEVARAVRDANADFVINSVAYTAVDKAEGEQVLATMINANTVHELAIACAKRGLPLIHVSTDYVFDGAKPAPYNENDVANPLNIYGKTKLAGEQAIQSATSEHIIVRTSWVYSAHGSNFVKTMLRLGAEREIIKVVNDQYGAPTSASDLAAAILAIVKRVIDGVGTEGFGIFHYTGGGETNWHEFATAIKAGAQTWRPFTAGLEPIPAEHYSTAARRPINSRLACDKIRRIYGVETRPWRVALERVLAELRSQEEAVDQ